MVAEEPNRPPTSGDRSRPSHCLAPCEDRAWIPARGSFRDRALAAVEVKLRRSQRIPQRRRIAGLRRLRTLSSARAGEPRLPSNVICKTLAAIAQPLRRMIYPVKVERRLPPPDYRGLDRLQTVPSGLTHIETVRLTFIQAVSRSSPSGFSPSWPDGPAALRGPVGIRA